ncbi:SET methyltransferase domain containing protein [Nitzschia inconspicua]|uniref:SET methyltransferase domain containing protein n=1 Tax=Nitzschia inconspicua TaxID=303405 RepID=A0A9K3LGR6_9STRA|nr:SET methyltransferase domain containing protein [Nitzschia inconspicua]
MVAVPVPPKMATSLALLMLAGSASSFSFNPSGTLASRRLVDVDENTPRDVYTMEGWSLNCGVQKADGLELVANYQDGLEDFCAMTQQDLPAGSPVLFVPNEMILSSSKATQEFGGALQAAESLLTQANLEATIPLFRIFCKILVEYEKGDESPWFPWMNSLPRRYNNGASMTFACFELLPPYAGWLAMKERVNFVNFQKAVQNVPIISEEIRADRNVLKWAYNVAVTRSLTWTDNERLLAPMADMFNHGAQTEVDISFDEQGNCMAFSSRDVPAGTPLRISLGDPTNPSPLFATYGFLDDSSPATFCKLMDKQEEMRELGYDFSNLLFFKDTGDISMEVYDVILYSILGQDPTAQRSFYEACRIGDTETKNAFHQEYFPYTLNELRKHVDDTITDLDRLLAKAQSKDPRTHPRLPVILKHNNFVKGTFLKVKENLDQM